MKLHQKLIEYSSPYSRETDASMVYELWEDGELTLTKCGSLYGARTLHTILMPILDSKSAAKLGEYMLHVPGALRNSKGHVNIALDSHDKAVELRKLMIEELIL